MKVHSDGGGNGRPACTGEPTTCACVIDTSTADSLERDFHDWLHLSSSQPQSPASNSSSILSELNNRSGGRRTAAGKPDGRRRKKTGIIVNSFGRRFLPGRPLDMAERRLIVDGYFRGMKVNYIAKSLCVSHGCVSKIIARYRTTGALQPVSATETRRRNREKRLLAMIAGATTNSKSDNGSLSTDEISEGSISVKDSP